MVFSTIIFLFRFLPTTLALYYLAPAKLKNTVLFLCSLVFYCWGEVRFFPVMVALILINYISGLAIEHFDQRPALRRAFLLAALIGSLGMLFYFKYANFVLRSVNALLGTGFAEIQGIGTLPLGISFYTFQTLSYSIDVYRRDVKAERNIIDFGAYVVMFPQLIAGPIVKYRDVSSQLHVYRHRYSLQQLEEGETVYITELGKEWLAVVKQGVKGYVLADRVNDLRPAHDGIELPEDYQISTSFTAVYSATADVNLSIRKEKDEDTKLIGTVYENESVDVMELDDQWARVKKGDADGYVLRSHLRYFRRYDPYGPYVPGVVFYPYAAVTTENTEIVNSETGESLRTVPKGAVMAVSAMQEDLSVTLPYDRITGRIRATGKLELEVVHPWNEAQTGDLIAVFSTYYDPEQTTQTQIGRLHNIMQGVERLNDVIVPSGEKFYFNDYCAPYTKSNGYEMGPIVNYVSSQKLGYGGGICQVSTTLYNAILQIPIGVIKAQVHSSYGISYVPLDMDAAVGKGNIDLRLQNTLPYDVRFALQAVGGVLTVRVYRAS